MTTTRDFITRHPVLTYSALTFVLSWGAVILVFGPGGIPAAPEDLAQLAPLAGLAMLVGPSGAGLLLTGLVDGRAGLRELLARLLRWRVGARWYAIALLVTPLVATAVSLALAPLSREFLPAFVTTGDQASQLLAALAAGLMVGIFEELGWTGFAVPRLRRQYGILATGLLAGLLWGAWHFPLFWERDSFTGGLPLALLLGRLFSWLPAYRLLLVWVYRSDGEPPRGYTHAREPRGQHAGLHAPGGRRGAWLDLHPRIRRCVVGHRRHGRRGHGWASFAPPAPETGGVTG